MRTQELFHTYYNSLFVCNPILCRKPDKIRMLGEKVGSVAIGILTIILFVVHATHSFFTRNYSIYQRALDYGSEEVICKLALSILECNQDISKLTTAKKKVLQRYKEISKKDIGNDSPINKSPEKTFTEKAKEHLNKTWTTTKTTIKPALKKAIKSKQINTLILQPMRILEQKHRQKLLPN